jgi:hypothetical protein
MARLWSCGFELQSLTKGMEVTSVVNSPTIDTTIKRSGAASLRCNPSATTAYISQTFSTDTTPTVTHNLRFYVYITTATDALDSICVFRGANNGVSIRMNSNRTLELWGDATGAQIGSDSSALSVDTWYRIELQVTNSGGLITNAEAFINGSSFASGNPFPTSSATYFRIGACTSTTCDLYFDDLAFNDDSGTTQNGLPGAGQIGHLYPIAAGDTNDANAGDYTSLDEKPTPDNATSYVELDDNNDIIVVRCEAGTACGLDSDDSVTLVQVGVRHAAETAAAMALTPRIMGTTSGSVQEGDSFTHNDVTWKTNGDVAPQLYKLTSYVNPQDNAAWEPADIDAMQIGVKCTDATPDAYVSSVWALVESPAFTYVGTTPPTSDTILRRRLLGVGI